MTLGIWSSLSGKSLIFLWFMLTQAEYFSFFLLLLAIKKSFYSLKVFRLDAKYKSFAFLEWTNEYCNEMHLCFSKNCIFWHNCQFWHDQRLTVYRFCIHRIDFFGSGCFSIFNLFTLRNGTRKNVNNVNKYQILNIRFESFLKYLCFWYVNH